MIKEYRADGWPLCPYCGEDELWSKLLWLGDGERPPIKEYIKAGLSCYRCGWPNGPSTDLGRKLTVKEAADLVGYSITHVGRLCRQGKIVARPFGHAWAVDEQSLKAYAANPPKSGPHKDAEYE